MSKFCTNCGKKLAEGKSCNCKATKEESSKKVVVDTKIDTSEVKNNVIEIVKGIFTKPVITAKKYATVKNLNLGYILLAIAVIAQAIFITVNVTNSVEEINDTDGAGYVVLGLAQDYLNKDQDEFEGFLGTILEIDIEDYEVEISVKTINLFITSAIITALYYGLIIGAFYIVLNKIMKKEVNIKKMLVTVSLVTMIDAVVMLAATLVALVFPSLVLPIVGIGALYFIITLYQVIRSTESLDEDKFPLMFVASYTLLAAVVYVLLQLVM